MSKKAFLCALFCVLSSFLVAAGEARAAILTARESALLQRINAVRSQHLLPRLAVDRTLVRAARAHSRAMLQQDVFAHGDFAGRMRAHGVQFPRLAENLAWGTGSFATARWMVTSWLASPGHRANLLDPRLRAIGIGAPVGIFSGYPGTAMVTTDFGG
ncbi:MAG: CAP domain-containing protein [Actinobacteria bacterium]|nr:CAP domain-containing protein [Actinomycetota bacterium]